MRRALLLAIAVFALWTPTALANGDPASDVLITQQVYIGPAVPLSQDDRETLIKTVAEANERGYPIRVALIAFTGDLGTATVLWRHPQDYAKFLGSELAFVYTKRLLIAMPAGFGIYHRKKPVTREQSALRTVKPGTTPPELARSAVAAVRVLAASDGIVLPKVSTGGGSDWRDRLIIAGAAVAILLIAFVPGRKRLQRRGRPTAENPP